MLNEIRNAARYFFVACIVAVAAVQSASAALLYDESSSGDLADFIEVSPWISPGSALGTLTSGAYEVVGGYVGTALPEEDSDVLTFEIAASHQLDSIDLFYTVASGSVGNGSYAAIQAGPALGTGIGTVGDNLSNALINSSGDLLAVFAAGPAFGGLGLTAPLPAGIYTLGIHETGGASVAYSLIFNVSQVPEPSAVHLLGATALGLAGCVGRRTRSRRVAPHASSGSLLCLRTRGS